jgi:hypothetical protein
MTNILCPIMKRSLGQTKFFLIFLTFGRDTTNYRGTLVENVKKVKNQPTLSLHNDYKYASAQYIFFNSI